MKWKPLLLARFNWMIRVALLLLIVLLTSCSSTKTPPPKPKKAKESVTELFELKKKISDNAQLLLYYQESEWLPLCEFVVSVLKRADRELQLLLGPIGNHKVTVALIEDGKFFTHLRSPHWVNAIYHKERIFVPLPKKGFVNRESLRRSLRHEYAHAILDHLAETEIPGWLDEGFASWYEGEPHPASLYLLSDWLLVRNPVPLSKLQGGFTGLESQTAKVAYAQSRFAADLIITNHSIEKLRTFIEALKTNQPESDAFRETFGLTLIAFEGQLRKSLTDWSKKFRKDSSTRY